MTTSAEIKIDREVKSLFDNKIVRYGFRSRNDVTTYLVESYINHRNGYKVDKEVIPLFEYAPRQLAGSGYTFGEGFYIGEFGSDWMDRVRDLSVKTEFKSVGNLVRNLVYAFILLREGDTVRLRRAIENYRLRRSRFPVPAKLQLPLNKAQVLRLRELYGPDIKETALVRNIIRLLIQYREGEVSSCCTGKMYRMFISGKMTDTVFKDDVEKKIILSLKKREDRNGIARLMLDHNIRSGGYLMRRITYMLLNPCGVDSVPDENHVEDSYEEFLFDGMARKDYGFQNYRR